MPDINHDNMLYIPKENTMLVIDCLFSKISTGSSKVLILSYTFF